MDLITPTFLAYMIGLLLGAIATGTFTIFYISGRFDELSETLIYGLSILTVVVFTGIGFAVMNPLYDSVDAPFSPVVGYVSLAAVSLIILGISSYVFGFARRARENHKPR